MPLSDPQIAWLDSLGKVKAKALKEAEVRAARREALAGVQTTLDGPERDRIRTFMESVEIEMKPEGFVQKIKDGLGFVQTMKLLEPGGDPMKELDSWHDIMNSARRDPGVQNHEQNTMLQTVQREVVRLQMLGTELRNKTLPDGTPLYATDAEFARDFWEPLVREGVIPENLVPAEYSEVDRTMNATVELYEARLTEYAESLTTASKFMEKLDLPVTLLAKGLQVGSAALSMDAAIQAYGAGVVEIKDNPTSEWLQKRADIVEGVATCLTSVKKAADAAVVKKDYVEATDAFLAGLKGVLKPIVGDEVTTLVVGIAKTATRTVPLGKAIADKDIPTALGQLGDAIAGGLDAASDKDELYSEIGAAIKAALLGAAAGTAFAQKMEAGKTQEAFRELVKNLNDAAVAAGGAVSVAVKRQALEKAGDNEAEKEKIEKLFKKIDKQVEKGGDTLSEQVEVPFEIAELLTEARESYDEAAKAQLEELAVQQEARELEAMLEDPDPRFDAMLAYGFSATETDADGNVITEEMRLEAIETLMAEIKRNEKIYGIAKAISTGGLGVVAEFVPGVGVAKVATQMCFAFAEAYKKTRQFKTWYDNTKDASAAATVQLDAMMNRYGLAKSQMLEKDAAALLAAIKLVGEAMKLAGHLSPVGYAVSAAASGSEAIMGAATAVMSHREMEEAWKTYLAYLKTPKDRKLARMALRQNPTLAKYAMAYGAVVEGNPIAMKAMERCGLNEKTMAQPSANVGKVVAYLELVYKDDPKLLREMPPGTDWYSGTPQLTLDSWAELYHAARTKSEPPLADQDVSGIVGALTLHDGTRAIFLGLSAQDPGRAEAARNALADAGKLLAALMRYTPDADGEEGGVHLDMMGYVKTLRDQCTACRKEYEAAIGD